MEPLATQIDALAHTHVRECYQCGKCTAGCPVAERMANPPNQIIRWVQIGQVGRALRGDSIWECVSCQTCSTRCPKSVNCAGVIDALRQLAVERAADAPARRRVVLFQKAFLHNIRRNGRLSELDLVRQFKTAVFFKDLSIPFLLKDALLGPRMFQRGKLHLTGQKVRDRELVDRIFARCLQSTPQAPAELSPEEHP